MGRENFSIEDASWYPFSDEPLVEGHLYAPKFCDPRLLLPENSCDEKWHLFFHSWIGIHHFTSDSGIVWEPRKMIEVRGHSPFIFQENENFYLLYEKHERTVPIVSQKSITRRGEKSITRSRIEMRSSSDLISWSKPRLLLDSSEVPCAIDYLKEPHISRPQLVKKGNEYLLFFGASHLILPDTRQKVSRYFCCASSNSIEGPYRILNDGKPIIESNGNDEWCSLGVGSIKVFSSNGIYYGLHCPVRWNVKKNSTETNLLLLKSENGINWERVSEKPILTPSAKGWSSSYIMSCDAQYKKDEKCWYCFFSANGDTVHCQKRESIGLLLGNVSHRKKTTN